MRSLRIVELCVPEPLARAAGGRTPASSYRGAVTAPQEAVVTPGNEAGILMGPEANADALYRQGMSYYRAREWGQARECFVRLRALDPERRGIDTLLAELDHFIRLDTVRPGVDSARPAPGPEPAPPAPARQRRLWPLWVGLAVALLASVALLSNSWTAAQPTVAPTPTVATASSLLVTRVAGSAKLHRAGTDVWQDVAADVVLNNGDRLRPANGGVVELRLQDGTVLTLLNADTMVEFVRGALDQADWLQVGGSALLQVHTVRLSWATPGFVLRDAQPGTIVRVHAREAVSYLEVEKGRTAVWIGTQMMQLGENDNLKAGGSEPPAVTRRMTPTATRAVVVAPPPATATGTRTPSPSATATQTPEPPTPTVFVPPTNTPPPTATHTPAAPTWTPIPPPTPTSAPVTPPTPPPPPTNTPVPPPTATPKR